MSTAQVRDPLPVLGMIAMVIAAVVAAAVSWWGWPDMADTLEEVIGPNRTPSVATKGAVAVGSPTILLVLAILPWPLLRADRLLGRRVAGYGGGLSTPEASRRRARGLSIVWCGLAVMLAALHVCLVGEMTGHATPMLEVSAVSFGIFLLAFAAAIPYFRRDPATIPPSVRPMVEGFDRGYRRAVPLLRASAAATIVLGVQWPIVALTVGCVGMCAALMLAAVPGVREG